jgi:hypothetical protein
VGNTNVHKWVRQAKVILSPFARPNGWYFQFENRSVVFALLRHAQETPIRCTWKETIVREYKSANGNNGADPVSHGNFLLDEGVSDNTLRVENCPYGVTDASLLNFFSRYDLRMDRNAIHRWNGVTSDGKSCPETTVLVHFADASWARAALREKQGTFMSKFGAVVSQFKNPKPLHLEQYPRQILKRTSEFI